MFCWLVLSWAAGWRALSRGDVPGYALGTFHAGAEGEAALPSPQVPSLAGAWAGSPGGSAADPGQEGRSGPAGLSRATREPHTPGGSPGMRQAGSGAGKAPEGGREGERAGAGPEAAPEGGKAARGLLVARSPAGSPAARLGALGLGGEGRGPQGPLSPQGPALAGRGRWRALRAQVLRGRLLLPRLRLSCTLSLRVSVFIFVVVTSLKTLNPLLTGSAWQGQPRLMLTQQTLPQDSLPIDRWIVYPVRCWYGHLHACQRQCCLADLFHACLPLYVPPNLVEAHRKGNPLPFIANTLALCVNLISRLLLTFVKPKGGGQIKPSCSTDASLLSYSARSSRSEIKLTSVSLSDAI